MQTWIPVNPTATAPRAAARTNRSALQVISTALLLVLPLLGCPAGRGSNSGTGSSAASQTATAGSTASATAVPSTSPRLSRALQKELPLDASFTIESVRDLQGGGVEISVLSSMDTLKTSTFLISALQQLGYESSDNASRILEGVSYSKTSGNIRSLYIKVSMESDEQCRVNMKTSK